MVKWFSLTGGLMGRVGEDKRVKKSLNVEEEADWGRSEGKVFEDERLSA